MKIYLSAIAGFSNFTTALANNGYSVSNLTVKFGLASLGEDIEGQDWFFAENRETRLYRGGNITFLLQGEDLIGCGSFKKRKNEVRQPLGEMVE